MRQFASITLPLLTPIVFFNLVLQVINAFQTFTQSYIVSSRTGGPVDSTCSTPCTSIKKAGAYQ